MSLVMRKPVPGPTQTGVHRHRRSLDACNFRSKKKRDRTIPEAKTKRLISCAVTAQLICIFVFSYVKKTVLLTLWLI